MPPVREEEIKLRVARDVFPKFDCTRIIGNVDFCVSPPGSFLPGLWPSLLWAEAKAGTKHDIRESLVQLILTIGRARTHERHLPPPWLGAFDAEKIAFIPFSAILSVLAMNDFNWNVPPSDHGTLEFARLAGLVADELATGTTEFRYDDPALAAWIVRAFAEGAGTGIPVTRNNFVAVYQQWAEQVKPSIAVDWEAARKAGILDADFFLADLLSSDNVSIRDALHVLLKSDRYELAETKKAFGLVSVLRAQFRDGGQEAHARFWNRYMRPPAEDVQDYIVDRRDLLVPQDIRERRGSYFTPARWVTLSQQRIAAVLGEKWQEEWTIWDCAAGTGNLLNGLSNEYNVWASTLDPADVDVMRERIRNGANLLNSHIFQFDFLNDPFDRLPKGLRKIVEDPEARRRLLIYINPPYAEASNRKQVTGTGESKAGVAKSTKAYQNFAAEIGPAARELSMLFHAQVWKELRGCSLAVFSKTKHLQAPNFRKFREVFTPRLEDLILVPAYTFDNVRGEFPIGFALWNTAETEEFDAVEVDVFDAEARPSGRKLVSSYRNDRLVIDWLRQFHDKTGERIAWLRIQGTDFQHNNGIFITSRLSPNDEKYRLFTPITADNVIETAIYCAIRHTATATWLNDRDHFVWPADSWREDLEFHGNCLVWAIFDNVISCSHGANRYLPWSEREIGARDKFSSDFMRRFMAGKVQGRPELVNAEKASPPSSQMVLSQEARAALEAGRELFKYYHGRPNSQPDASYYDIRAFFQGRDARGQMRTASDDAGYTARNERLKECLKALAARIAGGTRRHGFLKD